MASTSTEKSSDQKDLWDYIIVGGGTAGLVVASRLSEDPAIKVLVVEAGMNHQGDVNVDVPGLVAQLYGKKEYDWGFMSQPQAGLGGRQIACPRGRGLGGSSLINFSQILFPSRKDFQNWTELGNRGWNSDDMDPYLRKFQNFHPPADDLVEKLQLNKCVDKDIERTGGPLNLTFFGAYGASHEAWGKSITGAGMDVDGDPIKGNKIGAFTNPLTIDPSSGDKPPTRATSASAYYNNDMAARPNLKVLTESVVRRVVFDETKTGGDLTANGVEFLSQTGEISTVGLRQGGEVILSAGVIKSPQLLELSGIGQESLLQKHKIDVLVSSHGVGENLQDHPMAAISFEVVDGEESLDIMQDPEKAGAAFAQYQTQKSGPLAGVRLGFAYLPLVDAKGLVDQKEIASLVQTHLRAESSASLSKGTQSQHQLLEKVLLDPQEADGEFMLLPMQLNMNSTGSTDMSVLFNPTTPGNYISFVAYVNRPFSRGTVHIVSADPLADPAFDPRYVDHPLDHEILARLTQYTEVIAKSGPMSKVLKENGRRIPEGGDLRDLDSARKIATERCFTAFHPCGTCAMMPRELDGVVSDRLKVYGTNNLRVVDASIFPTIPVGNIQATVYAAAERAADIIKVGRVESRGK